MAWHDNSNHLLHSIARMHYSSWYRVSYRDVFAQLGLRAQPKNFNLNLRPFHNIMNIEINLIGLKTAACHAKKCVSIHDTRLKRHIASNSRNAMIKNKKTLLYVFSDKNMYSMCKTVSKFPPSHQLKRSHTVTQKYKHFYKIPKMITKEATS